MRNRIKKYTKPEPQTEITPRIEEICTELSGDGLYFIASAIRWISENLRKEKDRELKEQVFRERPAGEIVEDGYVTGCTDIALVFIALCRAKGIPTKYTEAIDKKWLSGELKGPGIRGHVFAECFVQNEWYQIDPMRGVIHVEPDYSNYAIFDKGLDSWDLGIRSLEDLREKFKDFRAKQR